MVRPSQAFWTFRWWKSVASTLGDIWQSHDARKAYEAGQLASKPGGGPAMRLAFRNATPIPLIICWISEQGTPHHFYTLPPRKTLPVDATMVTTDDRTERTCVGHAFAFAAHCSEVDVQKKHLDPSTLIGGYRPERRSLHGEGNDSAVHIVTIMEDDSPRSSGCTPWGIARLRKGSKKKDIESFNLSVQEGTFDPTPIDTSKKHYDHITLGGWPVRAEPNWHGGDKELQERLESDLRYASEHLPEHARTFLKTCTPIYVNRSQQYGPAACPVVGRGLCFHPDAQWLRDNGMSTDKAECVELYEAAKYKDDCTAWGSGGVLLHELSHAYHWKMLSDGYENKEIKDCWKAAMKAGLYDCVPVHGSQGPTAKAYACTNQMEYFAELSAAFLGGLDKDEEYNKWFPFCRQQVKEHDPLAYQTLQRVWRVNCDSP